MKQPRDLHARCQSDCGAARRSARKFRCRCGSTFLTQTELDEHTKQELETYMAACKQELLSSKLFTVTLANVAFIQLHLLEATHKYS